MKRWIAILPLVVLLALGAVFATFGLHHDPHFVPQAMVGQRAPAETLPRLDNDAATPLASQLQGPTIVNFFASWCAPCVEESPALLALKAEGARIIGVAYKDDPARTRDFLAQNGDPFTTILVDRQGRAGLDFGVSAVPETFLVGANGVILAKDYGALQPAQAAALLEGSQRPGTPAALKP